VSPLLRFVAPLLFVLLLLPPRAEALERICDVAYENCRNPLISLIRNEKVGIDVAFWFMEDQTLAQELIKRWQAGIPIRILMDTRSATSYPDSVLPAKMLRDAGIPMRRKTSGNYLHWKLMLFVGQNTVQFSGANYSAEAFMTGIPYSDYVDELIYFTHRPSVVDSFKTRFDDVWTGGTGFSNANIPSTRVRNYPTAALEPEMNFPPGQNFRTRSVALYKTEPAAIDAIMYRITDRAHADEMIAAVKRKVPVRLLTEPTQYRDPDRLWHAWNVDRMYMAGVKVRHRSHKGLSHEKLTILGGQHITIFGSSNWTDSSAASQYEHNLFTADDAWFTYAVDHFNRKWNNLGSSPESTPFVPLAGHVATLKVPADGAAGIPVSVTLKWWAGPWNHKYDVYLGTSPTAMTRVASNRELGPSSTPTDLKHWSLSGLVANQTYYWKVVSRTMANLTTTSPTFSFTTASGTGEPAPAPASLPSGWSNRDIGVPSLAGSAGHANGTFTVKGSGADIWNAADEFHYAWRTMTGNGTITARVATLTKPDDRTKAGVMIRETLNANSKHAAMVVNVSKGLQFLRRIATGGETTGNAVGTGSTPKWVRLTRSGSTFRGYWSADGVSWTLVGTQTISMTSTVQVGLAVTSHADGMLATATFTDVTTP
jgi:hypothetical protein